MRKLARLTIMLGTIVFVPALAYAQASIAGVVKDTSGAVLPGVTVEAASPALIEKTRSVITNGAGQYKVENLRPGTYSVTFTLTGFNAVKREGIELTGTFTATVNADLRVGAVEETITVTGQTPVVDVQNTKQERVLDRALIASIPSGRDAAIMASLLPGVTTANQDVGGIQGESGSSSGTMMVHGIADVRTRVNGLDVSSTQGSGTTGVGNIAAYQEEVVATGGVSAEMKEGGVQMNLIPREGGNAYQGSFYGAFANDKLQASNFTPELQAAGLKTPNTLNRYIDVNPSFGGPIKKDRLWFFGTARYNDASDFAPIFFNKNAGNPNAWTYVADTARGPAGDDLNWKGGNGRVTWQANAKNKLSVALDYVRSCQCPRSLNGTLAPESNIVNHAFLKPKDMIFVDWSAPLTSKLLVEASALRHKEHAYRPTTDLYFTDNTPPPGVLLAAVAEQSTGITYRAAATPLTDTQNNSFFPRMAVSYVTGSHALKGGFNIGKQTQTQYVYSLDSPMAFRFNNGVPNQITENATPFYRNIDMNDSGAFVQDRWTVKQLTLTGGLRYDHFGTSFPSNVVGPSTFTPARNISFPESSGVAFNDIEPRAGAALDVFGNGKTALKASIGKYLPVIAAPNCCASAGGTFSVNMAPSALLVTSATRSWTDRNGNFVPDCDLTNTAAQTVVGGDVCGVMAANFGTTRPGTTYDPDTTSGWNKRGYNWQFSTGIQQQIMPRVSVDVSYFRSWFGNFVVTDNRAVTAADYSQFSITAPSDPRLPGGGGYQVTGLYDVNPAKAGLATDNYITFASNFGSVSQHYNGVDVAFTARPRGGLTFQGGTSTSKYTTDYCGVAAQVPEATFGLQQTVEGASGNAAPTNVWTPLQVCHQETPFRTQIRFIGSYTLPRVDVQVSGTVQSLPGTMITANYTATNAAAAPSLGRPLSGGAANIPVYIVSPGTLYGDRLNQLDLRFGKVLKLGRAKTTASVDVYNVFNSNTVLTLNTAFASWQQPQTILNARFAKFILQFDF